MPSTIEDNQGMVPNYEGVLISVQAEALRVIQTHHDLLSQAI